MVALSILSKPSLSIALAANSFCQLGRMCAGLETSKVDKPLLMEFFPVVSGMIFLSFSCTEGLFEKNIKEISLEFACSFREKQS